MAARPPHVGVHEDGGVEPDHVVAAPDEALPPGPLHVVLELDAEGAVVPGAGEAAVYLAALEQEAPALAKGGECCQVECLRCSRHYALSVGRME